jgi:hypothetical protein
LCAQKSIDSLYFWWRKGWEMASLDESKFCSVEFNVA